MQINLMRKSFKIMTERARPEKFAAAHQKTQESEAGDPSDAILKLLIYHPPIYTLLCFFAIFKS